MAGFGCPHAIHKAHPTAALRSPVQVANLAYIAAALLQREWSEIQHGTAAALLEMI